MESDLQDQFLEQWRSLPGGAQDIIRKLIIVLLRKLTAERSAGVWVSNEDIAAVHDRDVLRIRREPGERLAVGVIAAEDACSLCCREIASPAHTLSSSAGLTVKMCVGCAEFLANQR